MRNVVRVQAAMTALLLLGSANIALGWYETRVGFPPMGGTLTRPTTSYNTGERRYEYQVIAGQDMYSRAPYTGGVNLGSHSCGITGLPVYWTSPAYSYGTSGGKTTNITIDTTSTPWFDDDPTYDMPSNVWLFNNADYPLGTGFYTYVQSGYGGAVTNPASLQPTFSHSSSLGSSTLSATVLLNVSLRDYPMYADDPASYLYHSLQMKVFADWIEMTQYADAQGVLPDSDCGYGAMLALNGCKPTLVSGGYDACELQMHEVLNVSGWCLCTGADTWSAGLVDEMTYTRSSDGTHYMDWGSTSSNAPDIRRGDIIFCQESNGSMDHFGILTGFDVNGNALSWVEIAPSVYGYAAEPAVWNANRQQSGEDPLKWSLITADIFAITSANEFYLHKRPDGR